MRGMARAMLPVTSKQHSQDKTRQCVFWYLSGYNIYSGHKNMYLHKFQEMTFDIQCCFFRRRCRRPGAESPGRWLLSSSNQSSSGSSSRSRLRRTPRLAMVPMTLVLWSTILSIWVRLTTLPKAEVSLDFFLTLSPLVFSAIFFWM